MALGEAIELIRSEQAILWAGSGFSLYAGYPNAQSLGESIIKAVPTEQKNLFKPGLSLDDVCELHIKINGNSRQPLLNVLKSIFSKLPKSLETHKKLSKIPHFKTIITTNYDTLFEAAFDTEIQTITDSNELRLINNSKTHLFKIHGDLKHPDNLIISHSDYANFYHASSENVFWTTVKERTINNSIVFIGYSLGDINIETILNSIAKQLGKNIKQHYLVAPDLANFEIEYLKSKNIKYVNSTGEKFIDILTLSLKENIVKDFGEKRIGIDTLNKFLVAHDLTADFLASDSGHSIGRIVPTNNKPYHGVVTIKSDESTTSQINDFLLGKKFGQFELGNSITKFNMIIAGINFIDERDLKSVIFVSRPNIETTFDIVFSNGFGLRHIPVKLYFSKYKTSIVVNFRNKKIELEFSKEKAENIQVTLEHGTPYGNPQDEIEAFKLMKYLVEGQSFTIFLNNGKKYPGGINCDEPLVQKIGVFLEYFEMLLAIEEHFEIRFNKVDEITNSINEAVWLLFQSTKNELVFYDFDGPIEATIREKEAINTLIEMNLTANNEMQFLYKEFSVSLYGQTIQFKERTWTLYDAEIINIDEVVGGAIFSTPSFTGWSSISRVGWSSM